jgi:hypothetical protein
MGKFDTSTGMSSNEIGAIKHNIRNEIMRQLPELPDLVETQLFLQGRSAWSFTWNFLNRNAPVQDNDSISIEVSAKLKKEFHCHQTTTCHKYMCSIRRQNDIYNPDLSVTEIAA